MASNTKFRSISNYGEDGTTEQLESNLLAFIDWGFLCVGAWQNVYIPTSGVFGGNPSTLRKVSDSRYVDDTVWEGYRQNWIWESGIDYSYQPIAISGVYVNNTFIPRNSTGVYAHTINYPEGKIIFNTPITGSPTIQAEYSFRHVKVDLADSPWFQQVQYNSYRADDATYSLIGSGAWNIFAQNRLQLPAVVVNPVLNVRREGLYIGDYTNIHNQDAIFEIFAETDSDRKKIHDILISQQDMRLSSFDKIALLEGSGYPIAPDGSLNTNPKTYPELVTTYPWHQIRIMKTSSVECESDPPLYRARVRASLQMDLP